MAKENISVKFLIHLVGERPALWDKTSEDYKDRSLKDTSWREICTYINENYNTMPPRAKEEFTRMIMKKWTHIRDSWVKSMKYGYDEVTKKPPKPYVYHNELKFMQKILKCKPPRFDLSMTQLSNLHFEEFYREKNETQNSNGTSNELENNEEEEPKVVNEISIENFKQEANCSNNESKVSVVNKAEDVDDADDWQYDDNEMTPIMEETNSSKQTEAMRKKRRSIFVSSRNEDEYEEAKEQPPAPTRAMTPPSPLAVQSVTSPRLNYQRIDQSLYENRHWNFFKGILPSVNDLDEDHVLQFQSGIIALLQKLRESQKQKLHSKSKWIAAHSMYKGRGRKRKASCNNNDDGDDNNVWATHSRNTRKRSTRKTFDPIAPEDDTEYSSDN